MNAKQCFVALLSALALMSAGSKLDGAPFIFFFSGDITSRRAANSVFTAPNTDQFYGYFSYDPATPANRNGLYPWISFSVDGNSFVLEYNPFAPGYIGVSVDNDGLLGLGDSLNILGIYPPATNGFNDNGFVGISFIDHSGLVFTNNNLPTSLNLASFDTADLQGPRKEGPGPPFPPATYDQGTITQLTQVPEPAAWGLLGLGLVTVRCCRQRGSPAHGLRYLIILILSSGLFASRAEAQNIYTLSPQNIVQNGSFEVWNQWPPPPWTGNFGLMLGFDGAADGRNFADISYTGNYAAQSLTTMPGQAYEVSFALSGNSSFPGKSIVQLSWAGTVVGNTTWTSPYTPGNGLNFNWVYGDFNVVATSSSTVISFQRNPASTASGTWLDAVQVVPVPEPCSLCFLSIGILALILRPRGKGIPG